MGREYEKQLHRHKHMIPGVAGRLALSSVAAMAMLMPFSPLAPGGTALAAVTGTWQDITNGGPSNGDTGIAVDSAGDVFVMSSVDFINGVVFELPSGSSTWKDITNSGFFLQANWVAVDSAGDVFVTGMYNQVAELPHGSSTWQDITNGYNFRTLNGIAVDGFGDVFVTNSGGVVELPHGGSTWQNITNGGPSFEPKGIAVNSEGDVFVTNQGDNTIEELPHGGSKWQDITNGGAFNIPAGITVDSAGDLFVANYGNNTIEELPHGSSTWKNITDGGSFNSPSGIAVDSAGNLFVTNFVSTFSKNTMGYTNSILESVVPQAPTGLSSSSTTAAATTLSWNTVSNAYNYNVYEAGNSTPIATGVAGTSYTIGNLVPGTLYSFTVTAENSSGESAQSSAVKVLTLPATPTGLASSNTTSTGTTLHWSAATGASNYNVYENGAKVATGVTGTSYTLSDLTPGSSYTFTVTAVGTGGESPQSSAVPINTAKIGTIDLTIGKMYILSGTSQTVTGVVYDVYNAPVPDAIVDLSSTIGSWSESSVTADSNGVFSATWTVPPVTLEMPAAVTATVNDTVYGAVSDVTPTTLAMEVAPPPSVGTTVVSGATEGVDYLQTLSATGGFMPYTWSLSSGSLPAGLTLNASTGVINGTPSITGTSTFTVQVEDSAGNKAATSLSIAVSRASTPRGGGASGSGTSGSGTSGSGTSGSGTSSGGTSSGGTSSGGTSSGGTSGTGTSSTGTSSGGTSGTGTSSTGTSSGGTSGSGTSSATPPSLPTVLGSRSFGNAGGTMHQNAGDMTISVNVPQGAFAKPEKLTVTTGTPESVTKLVGGLSMQSVGMVFGVNFSGATPTKPVTVTITNPTIPADGVVYKLTQGGELVPLKADVSAGHVAVSFTSDPDFVVLDVKPNERVITVAGHASIVPAVVKSDAGTATTYMPIWYVMQLLTQLNIKSEWDGDNWRLSTGSALSMGSVNPGTGMMHVYLNGQLVQNVTGLYATDPNSGKTTTFMPIWYVMQLLDKLAVGNTWDGTTWSVSS